MNAEEKIEFAKKQISLALEESCRPRRLMNMQFILINLLLTLEDAKCFGEDSETIGNNMMDFVKNYLDNHKDGPV